MAGTGKSTIMRTIAREFGSDDLLIVASFFFSRGAAGASQPDNFVTTIARQLANSESHPELRRYICEAISKDRGVVSKALSDQWNKLVLGPISRFHETSPSIRLVVVIDALDECESGEKVLQLVKLKQTTLSSDDAKEVSYLRFLLASRPEQQFRTEFRAMGPRLHMVVLQKISREIVDQDIKKFFLVEFSEIRTSRETPLYGLAVDWPGEQAIDILVQKAEGLFIYASTVCRFISTYEARSCQELLGIFLGQGQRDQEKSSDSLVSESATKQLDLLYWQVTTHSIRSGRNTKAKAELARIFREVMGSIVVLAEPLSTVALTSLLGLKLEVVYLRLRELQSVIYISSDVNSSVRLLHSSFRDFLLDPKRCRDPDLCLDKAETISKNENICFWVDMIQANSALAANCLRLMSNKSEGLKQDICKLALPGTLLSDIDPDRIQRCLGPELQYACVHWVHHAKVGNVQLSDDSQVHRFLQDHVDDGPVHVFMQQHMLHWLEALSSARKISEGVHAIQQLEDMVVVRLLKVARGHQLIMLPRPAKVLGFTPLFMTLSDSSFITD
jgi:hypothetical protein